MIGLPCISQCSRYSVDFSIKKARHVHVQTVVTTTALGWSDLGVSVPLSVHRTHTHTHQAHTAAAAACRCRALTDRTAVGLSPPLPSLPPPQLRTPRSPAHPPPFPGPGRHAHPVFSRRGTREDEGGGETRGGRRGGGGGGEGRG